MYDDQVYQSFFDELDSIQKEASLRLLGKGVMKARTGLSNILSGAAKKVAPKAPKSMPKSRPKASTGWTMGPQALTASPGSKIVSRLQSGKMPAGAAAGGAAPVHRAAETMPHMLESKQRLITQLRQRGMKVPRELKREVSSARVVPGGGGVLLPAPARAGGTAVARVRPRPELGAGGTVIT